MESRGNLDKEQSPESYALNEMTFEDRNGNRNVLFQNGSSNDDDTPSDDDFLEDDPMTDYDREKDGDAERDFSFAEEHAVLKKLDYRLVTMLAILYMLSFLDRSNIGNAKIAGLATDLKLSSSQYEWLLTAFYITYITFEWMTLMYRLVPPHIYVSICVFAWGLLASLQALATSFSSLAILRALLGISEAAFGPGVPFYLSFFYRREELALRTGLFISAAPLATSFAGSLAWAITKFGEYGPIAPWRLLFIAEGFPSVFVAAIAWVAIPDRPESARFLTSKERRIAKLRLVNSSHDKAEKKSGLDWREVWKSLTDPKCYIMAMMFFSCNVAFSSLPVFLPTIINDMGYSALQSQALSAPPYLVAFVVVITVAFLSDRLKSRGYVLSCVALLGFSGYALCAVAGWRQWNFLWRYFGVYLASAGFFSCITIIITWNINNQRSESGKGTVMAVLNIIGQCGPLLGTRLYPVSDGPYYVRGMTVCAAFMLFVACLSLILRLILKRANAKMELKGQEIEYSALNDDSKREGASNGFVYML